MDTTKQAFQKEDNVFNAMPAQYFQQIFNNLQSKNNKL